MARLCPDSGELGKNLEGLVKAELILPTGENLLSKITAISGNHIPKK